MMIHHTLKIVAMSPTENLISYPPKLDELSIVDFAVHNAIQLRSQLGITLFWGDNLVPKINFSVYFRINATKQTWGGLIKNFN